MNAIIEAVKNMNFLIFGLIIFDAWTDILLLKNMKAKFQPNATSSETLTLKPVELPKFLQNREIPENGLDIYNGQVKLALDESIGTLKYNYIQALQAKFRQECNVFEFVYEFNTKMTNFFNSMDERLGPSKYITEHRKNWFDYEKQIPDNLKSCEMEYIVNQFK